MLFLLFRLGKDRYALDAGQIAAVLPLPELKAIPLAPRGVAGLFNYRGVPVPVIDLCQLILGRPAEQRLSTRQVLVHYPDARGAGRLLALVAEGMTETLRCEPSEFIAAGIASTDAPYLGPVAANDRGLIQRIDTRALLPPSLRELLFQQDSGRP